MKSTIFAGLALAAAVFAAPAMADSCYSRASDGTCLDKGAPTTGQYTNAADQTGAEHVTNLRGTQAHANVKLTEATYIFAHNICRWVDNPGSRGAGIFVGLEAKTEWTSFIATPPSGVTLKYCCQPATVSICGKSVAIPFGVAGKSYAYSGGYDFKATYTCGANLNGIADTADTSWTVATSGACAAPAPDCTMTGDGGKDGGNHCDAGGGDDTGNDAEQHRDPNADGPGKNGDGPGAGGG